MEGARLAKPFLLPVLGSNPRAESIYPTISFLAIDSVPEYYLVLATCSLGSEVGVEGSCPAVKTRTITIAPKLCCRGFRHDRDLELFLA